jgi:hypothetical protein
LASKRLNIDTERASEFAVASDTPFSLNCSYPQSNQKEYDRDERLSPDSVNPCPDSFVVDGIDDHLDLYLLMYVPDQCAL